MKEEAAFIESHPLHTDVDPSLPPPVLHTSSTTLKTEEERNREQPMMTRSVSCADMTVRTPASLVQNGGGGRRDVDTVRSGGSVREVHGMDGTPFGVM